MLPELTVEPGRVWNNLSSDLPNHKNSIKYAEVRTKMLIAQKASQYPSELIKNDHDGVGIFSQIHFHNVLYISIAIYYANKTVLHSCSACSSI